MNKLPKFLRNHSQGLTKVKIEFYYLFRKGKRSVGLFFPPHPSLRPQTRKSFLTVRVACLEAVFQYSAGRVNCIESWNISVPRVKKRKFLDYEINYDNKAIFLTNMLVCLF